MAFLEDEDKQTLVDRYFDIEWCDDVSDLRCVHCHRVAINHFLSSCQHIFCKTCSKFYNDDEHPLNCPQCQEHISRPINNDFDVEVKIHQLKIFCPNKKYGCQCADQLRKIPSHLLTCTATRDAALPGKASVDQLTSINDVIGELRERTREVNNRVEVKLNEFETNNENIATEFNQLEKKTDDITTMVEKKVKGIELASKNHTEELQSMKSLLESINQRVQNIESLHQQTSSNVDEMKTKMTLITQEIEALQYKKSEELNIRKEETYEWTITDVEENVANDYWIFESDVFTFIGYDYKIQAMLEIQERRIISIYLQFRDGNTVNKNLSKIGFTRCKCIIRDQSNTQKKKDIVLESDLTFYDNCFANPNWIFGFALSSSVLSSTYLKDDCMKITISLEPPSIDLSFVSNNGVLVWTVDNYKTRKQEHLYSLIWSPTFYTSPQGYRVRIKLVLHYKEPMSLDVHFLTGEHDASLNRIFPHVITVTLFNQTNPSKNLVKSEKHVTVLRYSIELESSESVEQNGFIKDDSLLLKVVIEPF